MTSLDRLRDTWEGLGRQDALWAVLSDPERQHNLWDPEEFFARGLHEIDAIFRELEGRSLPVKRDRCLDFGCGVGRLSQALCRYFDRVEGVDIATSMVERANLYNRYGERCRYHVNANADLHLFESETFDFVYSSIVLQHMDPVLAEKYIAEFVRVLKPGGLAVFQVPSRYLDPGAPPLPVGSHEADLRLVFPDRSLCLEPGASTHLTVGVRNVSSAPWPSSSSLRLGNHWLDRKGSVVTRDDGRAALGRDVPPGGELRMELTVTAPPRPGRYVVELDLVEEGVAWFASLGSPTYRFNAEVGSRRRWWRRREPTSPRVDEGRSEGADVTSPQFEMHAVPWERVLGVVTSAGGEVLGWSEAGVSGPGWENYRYITRRPPPGATGSADRSWLAGVE